MNTNPILHYRAEAPISRKGLAEDYAAVRTHSLRLAEPLSPEDQQVQSMPDTSPTKWHLAHTTWFFETFVLKPYACRYDEFHPSFGYLFNSYYEAIGARHARPERGLLTRPGLDEIYAYRTHVDEAMNAFIAETKPDMLQDLAPLLETGLHHEQQHQELILMDIKHVLSCNPLFPRYDRGNLSAVLPAPELEWLNVPAGRYSIGHDGGSFCFDNETPSHDVLLERYSIASRSVTNREYLGFIEDGGYQTPELWHADGWTSVQTQQWSAPLYWRSDDDGNWQEFTLAGLGPLDLDAPVCHVSYYEAAAYAAWAGARLPTETEWETAARISATSHSPSASTRMDGQFPHSRYRETMTESPKVGLSGGVWEWTQSAYSAYPGFSPPPGAVGEYNGKFMVNQMVLRGASWATPSGHARISYRNFFYPFQRWAFSGIRLAR